MRKVFLLTGFQNWGKTRLIQELFSRQRFYKGALYDFAGYSFCVMPQSNDDLGKEGYEDTYQERMDALKESASKPKYIFSAFCPTKEPWNQSDDILRNLYSKDQVILIPIEYKWCCHAKLQLNEIAQHYSAFTNLSIQPLSQKDPAKKLQSLQRIVQSCLP
ncbi:MAG: hypothetical protein ACXV5H_09660 [Halobacteriota archaeon]